MRTYNNILEAIGNTPMVRLNRVGSEFPCEIYGKCEFLNPGGSVKDRIAYEMIEAAEREGKIKPGDILIEPTSGNTGIGLAMAAAIKGYKLIITLPEKMSKEKQKTMEALGAQIIRTPTEAAHDSPESNFGVAERLCRELPNAHILDQFTNPNNPKVHYEKTANEILEQMDNRIDYFISGAGTGGTITGVAKRLKEVVPTCKIIGADPEGSILGGGEAGDPYLVEGIGYDFIPDVLDQSLIDEYIKTNDKVSFKYARRLIKEEGLLVGGSSGSVIQAAYEIGKRCTGGERIVVMLADSIRNYMNKFLDNQWLQDHGLEVDPSNVYTDVSAKAS